MGCQANARRRPSTGDGHGCGPILVVMRRKAGTILPTELELLRAAAQLSAGGVTKFHGFLVANEMRGGRQGGRDLIAYGNLYRILERLERAGFLTSEWESPEISEAERRPRRRLYELNGAAWAALASAADGSTPLARVGAALGS